MNHGVRNEAKAALLKVLARALREDDSRTPRTILQRLQGREAVPMAELLHELDDRKGREALAALQMTGLVTLEKKTVRVNKSGVKAALEWQGEQEYPKDIQWLMRIIATELRDEPHFLRGRRTDALLEEMDEAERIALRWCGVDVYAVDEDEEEELDEDDEEEELDEEELDEDDEEEELDEEGLDAPPLDAGWGNLDGNAVRVFEALHMAPSYVRSMDEDELRAIKGIGPALLAKVAAWRTLTPA